MPGGLSIMRSIAVGRTYVVVEKHLGNLGVLVEAVALSEETSAAGLLSEMGKVD